MACCDENRLISGEVTAGVDYAARVARPLVGVTYSLHMRGPGVVDITADATGQFFADAATTAQWPAGTYEYRLRSLDANGGIAEPDRGQITVQPDFLALQPGADLRSPNEIALDAINAVLAKRATQDQQRYTINNRELWRTPIKDLLALRQFYALQVGRERRRRNGCGTFGRPIPVRFTS